MAQFKTFGCAVAVVVASITLSAHTLSHADIRAAVAAGAEKKVGPLVATCSAGVGFGAAVGAGLAGGPNRNGRFSITVSSSVGRIAVLAAEAARRYETFTPPEPLLTQRAWVAVEPAAPSRAGSTLAFGAVIERVILRAKDTPDTVVQPDTVDLTPVEWKNLLGAVVEGNRAVAAFPFDAVQALPAGDLEVVLVTASGERKCSIGRKDRDRVLGAH